GRRYDAGSKTRRILIEPVSARDSSHSTGSVTTQTVASTDSAGGTATRTSRPATRTRSGSARLYSTLIRSPAVRLVGYSTPTFGLWVTPSGVTYITADRNRPADSTSPVVSPLSDSIR